MYQRIQPEEKHPELRGYTMTLYVFVGLSAIMQYFETTMIPGLVLLGLCYLMVRAQKFAARETLYISHVEWIARTISIGTWFVFPAAMGIAVYMIWKGTDVAAVKTMLDNDDPKTIFNSLLAFFYRNNDRVDHIINITMGPAILWWIRRCVVGFLAAKQSEAISYPGSIF